MRIFFSGIAGSGMSGLAGFSKEAGHEVSGSDRAFDEDPESTLADTFRKAGIGITPQDGSGINASLDLAVFSTAVESDRPEVLRANALGIKCKTRPEFLRDIIEGYKAIAVAGTSGKSTASGMLAFAMGFLGMDPNFLGGGRVKQFRTDTNPGNFLAGSSDFLVVEACESDGALSSYRPYHSIILNISIDHHPLEKTRGLFEALSGNTRGTVFLNADDKDLSDIKAPGPVMFSKVTFSIEKPSGFRAVDMKLRPFGSEFTVNGTAFILKLPGRHNIYNALSSIAVLSSLGVPLKNISRALREFKGIERRFDVHLNDGERFVIDDYAHNPHKIASLMEAVRPLGEKACYIFQPHGFGPTRMMKEGYISAFAGGLRDGDSLIVLPILYKGGTVAKDISNEDLASGVRALGKKAEAVSGRAEVFDRLAMVDRLGGSGVFVVLGARDDTLSGFAKEIAAALKK